MNTGLRISNAMQELVVHSESRGTECIGKATLSHVEQPSTSGGVRTAGYSRYTFTSARPVLWAVDLPLGRRVGIVGTGYKNGVYTIGAYCGGNPDYAGFDQQYAVDIWAFSTISAASSRGSSGFGLLLRNSNGAIAHDFAAPNITFPVAAGNVSSAAYLPATGRPVAIGNSPYYDVDYIDREPGYIKVDSRQFLLRENDRVAYSTGLMFMSGLMNGNPPEGSTVSDPSPFFVIDGQFLP
ncbi:hypothetical protein [Janthinobacterium sp. P210006]|uniref:hypothetical protein n=1 Tax=Janthinobacterium sp. P210006 TaxID=3112939 RepID=UPI002E26D67C|nr:hypothetical protein [Janthinobacterium sp. P210006]